MINSSDAIDKLRLIGLSQAEIKDLFEFRYNLDFQQIRLGRLFMMPSVFDSDFEVLAAGYPSAYLIGFVMFFGLKILVSPKVLIPRPETEELMYIIRDRQKKTLIGSALDLCSGSACIGLSLKKMFPEAEVFASDISPFAIQQGQINAEENRLEINLALSDYLSYFISHGQVFDLIVSNPPYIKDSEILDSSMRFEPQDALFGGSDGLSAFRQIAAGLPHCLSPHGVAYFEMEAANAGITADFLRRSLPGFRAEVIRDMSAKDRFVRLTRF